MMLSPAALLAEHTAGWAAVHRSGIEIAGNTTVARAVNASLYYIHSAIRADWPHGLSPGGLATDSYDGRSFWDSETWMFPVLDAFYAEGLGRSLLEYSGCQQPRPVLPSSGFLARRCSPGPRLRRATARRTWA